jgi:hypothetical protein
MDDAEHAAPRNPTPGDILGYFDSAGADAICGWLCRRSDLMAVVRLDVVRDGRVLATVAADMLREDLRKHGIGTGEHGFYIDRSQIGVTIGKMADLSLYIAGSSILLKSGDGGLMRPTRMFRTPDRDAAAAFLAFSAATLEVVVNIDHPHAMIGDTITALPFIYYLARMFGRPVHVTGAFSRPVRALLPPGVAVFDGDPGPTALRFNLGVGPARASAASLGLHACQGFFLLADIAPPPLPMPLDLVAEDCGLPPGVVLAPFTASERNSPDNHVRMWYPDRWRAVADHLANERGLRTIYIIGASNDDFTGFDFPGVTHVIDRPMPQILDLMRKAPLCVTVETGPAHLAHFGGVSKHVLIYGDIHPPALVSTAIGEIVRGRATDVTVDAVRAAIVRVLDR